MDELGCLLRSHRGVVSRHHLLASDIGDAQIRTLVRRSALTRLRTGWYAAEPADQKVVEAVRAGGVLSCLSALQRHRVWVPEHERRVHVRVGHRDVRIPGACRRHGPIPPPVAAIDDIPCAVAYAARCLDDEGLVVVCDSALNSGLATTDELAAALAAAPATVRALIERCDGRSQSGTESMVRLRLRSRNIAVTTQPWIPGVGHVDLVVGHRLVIECDSRAHHTGVDGYETDRARDRTLIRLDYLPLRLSYRQIVHDWPASEAAVLDVIRRRDHRR